MSSQTAYTWGSIAIMVMCSTVGDVMISKSMKKVGDIGELRRHAGLVLPRFVRRPLPRP